MRDWLREIWPSLLLGVIIGVPLSWYAVNSHPEMAVTRPEQEVIIWTESETRDTESLIGFEPDVVPENPPKVEASEETLEKEEQNAPRMEYLGRFRLTAYCSCKKCCGKWAENRPKDENGQEIVYGASGMRLATGVSIAVDPKVISYGTTVVIDGHEYIAADCGGAIKGNRIDVYFDSHEEAWNFGVQYADVYLKKG